MGNSILDMMGNRASGNQFNLGSLINMLNGRFGNTANAISSLQGLIGGHGLNAEQLAMENLKGKTFSPEVIAQFRTFAKQNGMSDSEIDAGLKKLGLM